MLSKNRFAKKIFRTIREEDVYFKENDKKEYDLVFDISFSSLKEIEKINFYFDYDNNKPGIYEKSTSVSNKFTYLIDKSRSLENSKKIILNSLNYEIFSIYNKITLIAYNKYNNVVDSSVIKLSKSLSVLKDQFVQSSTKANKRFDILKNSSYLEYNEDLIKTRINIEKKYKVACKIYFNNKIYTQTKKNRNIIIFSREDFSDLYDEIDFYFMRNNILNLEYCIEYSYLKDTERYNQTFTLNKKEYSVKNKKRVSNKLYNSIKVTQTIDKQNKSSISISVYDKNISNKEINIDAINNFNNKKIKLFSQKNNDKKNEISNNSLNLENMTFFRENNDQIDNIDIKYKDLTLKIFKKDIKTIKSTLEEEVSKETKNNNSFYKKIIDFYNVLRNNFIIKSNINLNLQSLVEEKFEINIGSFKNVAESFGYNQEENDQNLNDEINFLKSCIFSLEKVYSYNKDVFDVKTVNFKLEDLFDLNNIQSNMIISNKNLNLDSKSLNGFLKYNKKENIINKALIKLKQQKNSDLTNILEKSNNFEYEVSYNLYAVPVDKTLKLIKNSGFNKNNFVKYGIYTASNDSNSNDIKDSNRNLSLFLDQVLPSNFSFTEKQRLKKLFLSKENIIESNNIFCKELITNTQNLNAELASLRIDKKIFSKSAKSNNKLVDSSLKPKVISSNLYITNNKIQKRKTANKYGINRDIIIDIKDTNISNVDFADKLKIRYIIFSADENNINFINKNKSKFSSYFFDLEKENYEIYENIGNNTKFIGIDIDENERKNILSNNKKYNILVEYTYIEKDLYIKNKNVISL